MIDEGKRDISSQLTCRLVYVSDVHLKDVSDQRSQLLLASLAQLKVAKDLEVLILGGDVFDFCFGASQYFRQKFRPYEEILTALASRGIKVFFLQGNHEFSVDDLRWPGIEFVTSYDAIVTLSCGTKVAMTHGDRFLADWAYRAYIGLTRSLPWKVGALLVPQRRLDAFALRCSSYSRDRGEYRDLNSQRVLDAAHLWVDRLGADIGLFGHFHFPFFSSRPDSSGKVLSVESWQRPNFLLFGDDGFMRAYPDPSGRQFTVERAVESKGLGFEMSK